MTDLDTISATRSARLDDLDAAAGACVDRLMDVAAELAAELLVYAERSLRPHVGFTTVESAELAAEALRLPTRDLELQTDEVEA